MPRTIPRQNDISSDVRDLAEGLVSGLCLKHVCVVLPTGAAVLVARRRLLWWPGRSG